MIFAFIFWLVLAILVGAYASSKGRSGFGFFIVAILLSPLIGFIIALIVQPIHANTEARAVQSGEYRKCPYCAELVKYEAIVCKHCGRDLPDEAVQAQHQEESKLKDALLLCERLKQGWKLNSDEYHRIAHAGNVSLNMPTAAISVASRYTVRQGSQEFQFKNTSQLRSWLLENVVPQIEGRA